MPFLSEAPSPAWHQRKQRALRIKVSSQRWWINKDVYSSSLPFEKMVKVPVCVSGCSLSCVSMPEITEEPWAHAGKQAHAKEKAHLHRQEPWPLFPNDKHAWVRHLHLSTIFGSTALPPHLPPHAREKQASRATSLPPHWLTGGHLMELSNGVSKHTCSSQSNS